MIARLSKRIASFFVCNEIIKSEDKEVYEYGLQLLLSTVFNGVIALIIAVITKTVLQCICYLAVFVILRKSAGGFHAKTHLGCCCILSVVLSMFTLFIKFVPTELYTVISILAVVFSLIMIILFAPLEHKNKPIGEKDKKRLRKNSIIYTVFISAIILILEVTNHKLIMVCLSLGMLTASGSMLVAVIEKRLSQYILEHKNDTM